MTRRRDGLLPRMEARPWSDGVTVSYRYHPLGGKPIALGTDYEAALRTVMTLNGRRDDHGSLRWLWERFTDAARPAARWRKLAETTRADYRGAWRQIDRVLGGDLPAASITSPQIARYVHIQRADAPRRADIEKALLSSLFKYGILLGVCTTNPTAGVEPHGSEPSAVTPQRDALEAFLAWLAGQTPQRRRIGLMAEYASLAGSRRSEFLDLAWPQVDRFVGGTIRTKRAKQRGGRRGEVIDAVEVTPALLSVLERARALAPEGNLYVFPNEDGNAYSPRGFATMWQRCMVAAIHAKVITESQRFNFHALRRHYVTRHRGERGDLPNLHADRRTTSRVYDATRIERRKAL